MHLYILFHILCIFFTKQRAKTTKNFHMFHKSQHLFFKFTKIRWLSNGHLQNDLRWKQLYARLYINFKPFIVLTLQTKGENWQKNVKEACKSCLTCKYNIFIIWNNLLNFSTLTFFLLFPLYFFNIPSLFSHFQLTHFNKSVSFLI